MPRDVNNTNDFRSNYPGRSTVNFTRAAATRYTTVEYSPFDSSGIDPTAFRKNAFAFDSRVGHQPRDYRHYDVHGGTYGERDSGYTQRGRENFGSSDRYGGSGGDKLSCDAARMRDAAGGYDSSSSSSGFGSEYRVPLTRRNSKGGRSRFDSSPPASRYDSPAPSRSHSRFEDMLRSRTHSGSRSSSRHARDHSPPAKYFGPDDIGRASSPYSTPSSMSQDWGYGYGGGCGSKGAHGSSGPYQTRIVTPGSGDYGSGSRRGSRSR